MAKEVFKRRADEPTEITMYRRTAKEFKEGGQERTRAFARKVNGYIIVTRPKASTRLRLHELQHVYQEHARATTPYMLAEQELQAEMGALQAMGRKMTYRVFIPPFKQLKAMGMTYETIAGILLQLSELYEIPLPGDFMELLHQTGKPSARLPHDV